MWAVSPIPGTPFLCRPTKQPPPPFSRTKSLKNDGVFDEDIDGLGHTVLSNLNSRSSSARERKKQKQEDDKQLSGSDVLWALQRAVVQKKKMNKKKKKEVSSADTPTATLDDDLVVDYRQVKPLRIKSAWVVKLEELEIRLQEISEFI